MNLMGVNNKIVQVVSNAMMAMIYKMKNVFCMLIIVKNIMNLDVINV